MNLQAEIRDGYEVSAQMKKVWAVQIDLLKKLLQVCERHGLKIWADGGTLLGTIRHKGYIPWDDDIDLLMFREDYDKLVQLASTEFQPPYFFQCGYTEKLYPRGHAQLRMDGTTAILAIPEFVDTHQGVFIDIFPYDSVPNNEEEIKKLIKDRNRMFDKLIHSCSFDWLHPFRSLGMLKYRGRFGELYAAYEDLFRKHTLNECNNVSCLSFMVDLKHFLRDKHWYDETIQLPFEDIMIPVPVGYHQILEKQYGDYMTPVKANSYHGVFWKLDAEHPYQDYLPELKRYLKKEKKGKMLKRVKKIFNRKK